MQVHSSGSDLHRALRHVVCIEGYHVGVGALKLSHEYELILLCGLLGHGLRRVIQLVEHVFARLVVGHSALHELAAQVVTEGLCRRQEHAAVAHRIAADEVEIAVGVQLVVIVQAVTAQHPQQRTLLHPLVGDVGEVHSCRVALVFDVEAEPGLLNGGGEVVHILHHQVPVALGGVVRRVLQCLHEECLRCLGVVACKLSHLVGLSSGSKLEGHGQHLVGLQPGLQ